jgi:hypothetical protein
MPRKIKPIQLFTFLLYVAATLQAMRYYVVATTFYLDMPKYLSGHERLPFQERVLPILLMWPINHSTFMMQHFAHADNGFDAHSAATPERLAFYIVSLASFAIASYLVNRLYRAVTVTGRLSALVLPVFMVLTLWTYVIHIDADFSYPYDMPSLAFFAGGLLAIYTRRFLPLLAIVLVGTFNRETTLFLIGIYVIDAASRELTAEAPGNAQARFSLRERFSLRQVQWLRVVMLAAVWLAVKATVAHHFRENDNSENYVRAGENLHRLSPRLWPILFNICGYTLPLIVLFRKKIFPVRFGNYLYILPFWFAVMFYTGVILESRVYGELCSFCAVAAVLLFEEHVASQERRSVDHEWSDLSSEDERMQDVRGVAA